MRRFETVMPHVVFGEGEAENVGFRLSQEGVKKVLVVCDPGVLEAGLVAPVMESMEDEDLEVIVYSQVVPDPKCCDVDAGGMVARKAGVDAIVGIGGGSAMDTAKGIYVLVGNPDTEHIVQHTIGGRGEGKAVKRAKDVILMMIPTTSGTGSEVSSGAVLTDEQTNYKGLLGTFAILPDYAICDPLLDVGLPKGQTAATTMDALTHAMESYMIGGLAGVLKPHMGFNDWAEMLSLEAIRRIFKWMPVMNENPKDLEGRANIKYACMLAGISMVSGGLTLAHGMGQAIGALWHIPHGTSVSICLPCAIKQGAKLDLNTRERLVDLAHAVGLKVPMEADKEDITEMICLAVQNLTDLSGIPTISELGKTKESDLDLAVETAMQDYTTMLAATEEEVRAYYSELFER